jgi:hypothetical protein
MGFWVAPSYGLLVGTKFSSSIFNAEDGGFYVSPETSPQDFKTQITNTDIFVRVIKSHLTKYSLMGHLLQGLARMRLAFIDE